MTSSILVTGASGRLGGDIARRLHAHGRSVRRLTRRPDHLPPLPGGEVVTGGYDDVEALRRAVDGVDAVFVVSLPGGSERVARHEEALRAAAGAGVAHVVYLSLLGAGADSGSPQGRWHHETEQALRGLLPRRWTSVRAGLHTQALLTSVGIVEGTALHAPAGNGAVAAVDRRDLAPVITRILLDGSHRGTALDVTGPALLDWPAVAAARGLVHVDADPAGFADRLRERGAPAHFVEGVLGLFADVRAGRLAVVSDAVTDVGGVLPRTLRESLEEDGPGDGGRRLVREFVAALDAHRPEAAGAVVAPDYRQHNAGVGAGRAGLVAATAAFLGAAPDLVADVSSLVETDQLVAATIRWTTGGRSWSSHDLWRHDGRQLLEHWDDVDPAALTRRLRPAG
jgi:uncharacterized protein YbjT (DUF2867 family)/predicted SnoaL-like aldol condensation-catalyzing enzyme